MIASPWQRWSRRQIAALIEPLDRMVVEHAGEQGADHDPCVVPVTRSKSPRPIALLNGSLIRRNG